jgi:hypothetical protein
LRPHRRSLIPVLLGVSLFACSLDAQQPTAHVDSAKAAAIRHLLQLSRTAENMARGMEAMLPAQRAANPRVPAAFWDAFAARARTQVGQLLDSLVPIYAAHFSRAEIDQLVQFYSSPIGQHLAEVQPLMTQESVEVGQRWGAVLGRQIADSLQRAGVSVP